ncbi:MAG: type II toxin-antitoxin system VapC family toxin [Acidobacteria bacterium]|nr:type II toxin-antitoxin system VapC family toxin [Acidobacteriota bacterium]
MIALDTNILVYAHRKGTLYHKPAVELLRRLSGGVIPYALFWPGLYEFLRVVTHHRVFDPPSRVDEALGALSNFLQPPVVRILSETAAHDAILGEVLAVSRVQGNLIHDAHLVALALEHGVHEILTLDDDFRRFPQISSRNPFRPA